MSEPARAVKIRLGDVLAAQKLISPSQLAQALEQQKKSGLRLVVHRLPESLARRFRAMLLEERRSGYLVGMSDPSDVIALDALRRALKRPVQPAAVSEEQLVLAIDRIYRRTEEISGLARELEQDVGDAYVDFGALGEQVGADDAPVVRLLQTIFEDAVQADASDVHIEPQERHVLRVEPRDHAPAIGLLARAAHRARHGRRPGRGPLGGGDATVGGGGGGARNAR